MKTSLPSVEELEEHLRNGVMLVQLGKVFLPSDPLWSKTYDLDESRYKVIELAKRKCFGACLHWCWT